MNRTSSRLGSLMWQCLFIAITAACFWNVFAANLALQQMAKEAACGGRPGCWAQMTEFTRTPIAHSYVFATPAGKVEVECRRQYILFGDYACKDGASGAVGILPEPVPTSSAKPASSLAVSNKPAPVAGRKPAPAVSSKPAPAVSSSPASAVSGTSSK